MNWRQSVGPHQTKQLMTVLLRKDLLRIDWMGSFIAHWDYGPQTNTVLEGRLITVLFTTTKYSIELELRGFDSYLTFLIYDSYLTFNLVTSCKRRSCLKKKKGMIPWIGSCSGCLKGFQMRLLLVLLCFCYLLSSIRMHVHVGNACIKR